MKTFVISDKCNGCGICSTMTDLILEDPRGIAFPAKDGYISDDYLDEANMVVESCSIQAISIQEVGSAKGYGKAGLEELEKILQNKLFNIPKINITKSDIKFDSNNFNIDYSYPKGEYSYIYSSDKKAENAGLEEFNRVAYSQYRPFILSVFIQYKNDKLKPFYTLDQKGFYMKNNKQYEDILKEIYAEANALSNNKIYLPDDFVNFRVIPGGTDEFKRENIMYGIENFEIQSTRSGVMEEFKTGSYSSLDSYKMYMDTDDMEMYDGDDWRGHPKHKTKYCYFSVNKAVIEYIKDLKSAMNYVDIDGTALHFLEGVISSYNEEIDIAINEKVRIFKEAIAKL